MIKVKMKTIRIESGILEMSRDDGTVFYVVKFSSRGKEYLQEFYLSYRGKEIEADAKQKAIQYQKMIKGQDQDKKDFDYETHAYMGYNIAVGSLAYSSIHKVADSVSDIYWYERHGVKKSVSHLREADQFAAIIISFKKLGPVGIAHVKENTIHG